MTDNFYKNKITKGAQRACRFGKNWEVVNINKIVNKFTPKPIVWETPGKLHFEDQQHKYQIIADIAGSYLRIMDLNYCRDIQNAVYLTKDGEDGRYTFDSNGKKHSRTKSDYMSVTHFRIMSWEEMKNEK